MQKGNTFFTALKTPNFPKIFSVYAREYSKCECLYEVCRYRSFYFIYLQISGKFISPQTKYRKMNYFLMEKFYKFDHDIISVCCGSDSMYFQQVLCYFEKVHILVFIPWREHSTKFTFLSWGPWESSRSRWWTGSADSSQTYIETLPVSRSRRKMRYTAK